MLSMTVPRIMPRRPVVIPRAAAAVTRVGAGSGRGDWSPAAPWGAVSAAVVCCGARFFLSRKVTIRVGSTRPMDCIKGNGKAYKEAGITAKGIKKADSNNTIAI